MPSTLKPTLINLTPAGREALERLWKASGASQSRIVETLLVRAYDEAMAHPERPVTFPRS